MHDRASACGAKRTWIGGRFWPKQTPAFQASQRAAVIEAAAPVLLYKNFSLRKSLYRAVDPGVRPDSQGAVDTIPTSGYGSGMHESRLKILNATLNVVREKGYHATRIEDVCAAAGLTKGSFFHHFSSKEELAIAAATHWDVVTGTLFASASYHSAPEPLDRLLGYIELRKALLTNTIPEATCYAGTIVQEAYVTHPAVREACANSIVLHARTLETDIEAAIARSDYSGELTAESLALHTQAVVQGAFILAKALDGMPAALDSLDHLARYFRLLFAVPARRVRKTISKEK
jgi:TetR/AcrR family transcriptional repressor of nem operon